MTVHGTLPRALLVVWFDVPPELDEEFSDWHNTEHLPERQSMPGFLSARRLVRVGGDPQYVALYDLEDVRVLKSRAYLRVSGDGESPWSRRIRRKATRIVRNVYEQVLPEAGGGQWLVSPNLRDPKPQGPAVILVPEDEPEPSTHICGDLEAQIWSNLANPGFRAARRFVAVEGQPRYLTVYELDHSDVLLSGQRGRPAGGPAERDRPFFSEPAGQRCWSYSQVFPRPEA